MYRVLIVDDEYFIRHGLEHTIEWGEYGVEFVGSAADGREALEQIKKSEPHIVITDIKMPNMNGIELLKEIRRSYSDIKVIIISGYNDFDYVKEALVYGVENYILKPINEDELSETLLTTINKIEREIIESSHTTDYSGLITENLLCRLVTNTISHKEACERLDFLKIDLKADSYIVCIIKIVNRQEDRNEIESDNDSEHANWKENGNDNVIRQELLTLLRNKVEYHIKNYIFCDLDGNIVILFCMSSENNYSQVETLVQKLINYANEGIEVDFFVTLGSEEKGTSQIYQSYLNAEKLQKYSYIYPSSTRLSYPKVILAKEKLANIYKIKTHEVKDSILSGNREGVELFYQKISENQVSYNSVTLDYIRNMIIELASELIGIIKEKKLWEQSSIINPDKLYDKLFGQNKLDDTIKWLKYISLNIMDEIIKAENKPKTLIERITDYLEKNYNQDISLNTIASTFYINPSYLGQTFKNETGELFSTYLNILRINKAKELLNDKALKASQISVQVGYNDPNYFYKVFKKYTGVYPSEFKTKDRI